MIISRSVRRVLALLGLIMPCFLWAGFHACSAPINGSWSAGVEVGSRTWSQTNTFRGGERAAVMAVGDRRIAGAKLRLAVYDAKGMLIAEDNGERELAGDFVGLVWYPPRDGEYKIEVSHNGAGTVIQEDPDNPVKAGVNRVYIVIK